MDILNASSAYADELYKLFQYIDQVTHVYRLSQSDDKSSAFTSSNLQSSPELNVQGYLEHDQLITFQKIVAVKENVQITKDEEDLLAVDFMRYVPKTQSNRNRIDWTCFYTTIGKWVVEMSNDVVHALQDSNGNMSKFDREALHSVIRAFFIKSSQNPANKAEAFRLLEEAHELIDNLERDVENMNISGNTD